MRAQTRDDGHLWLGYMAQGRLGPAESTLGAFRWWVDAHLRQRDEGEHLDLAIVRPGLGWMWTESVSLWGGYAWIVSDPVGRDDFGEHRTWQQLSWNIPVEGFTLNLRNRLEERFFETDGDTGWRLREMLKTTIPVTANKRVFVSVWDEAFFDLNDTDWGQRSGFRQNRAFGGLGFAFDDGRKVSVEVGYLNQWVDRRGEDRLNHALAINLFTNF